MTLIQSSETYVEKHSSPINRRSEARHAFMSEASNFIADYNHRSFDPDIRSRFVISAAALIQESLGEYHNQSEECDFINRNLKVVAEIRGEEKVPILDPPTLISEFKISLSRVVDSAGVSVRASEFTGNYLDLYNAVTAGILKLADVQTS
jgi:hypothetical protein